MKLPIDLRAILSRLRATSAKRGAPPDATATARRMVVRRMDFAFDSESVPRHWLGDNMVATALANSLNLIFPAGERFFVRSVHHYMDQLEPQLRQRVREFFGQEGQHARSHERLFATLEAHGFDIEAFLQPYQRLAYERIEPRTSPKLRLAVTAALEHFTATFAEHALRTRLIERLAPPVMQELLLWHAAEEIEHKDVAFDVLQQIDDSYGLRIAGLMVATAVLAGFWVYGAVILLGQDPEFEPRRAVREYLEMLRNPQAGPKRMIGPFLSYLRPGFHPSDIANEELAVAYLEEIGRRAA